MWQERVVPQQLSYAAMSCGSWQLALSCLKSMLLEQLSPLPASRQAMSP